MVDSAARIREHVDRLLRAEYDRLERDIGQAALHTPTARFGRLFILKADGLHTSVADAVGWMACWIDDRDDAPPV